MDITAAIYQLMMRQMYMQLVKRARVVEGYCYVWGCYVRKGRRI